MRHRVQKKKLNRDSAHRKALQKNLATSLIEHGSITTTLAKAKFVRSYIEKVVTKAKKDNSFTGIKNVNAKLTTISASRKLFDEIVPMFMNRNGGYTRIVRVRSRDGDNAQLAKIEWVKDSNKAEVMSKPKSPETKKASESKATAKQVDKKETKNTSKKTKKEVEKENE